MHVALLFPAATDPRSPHLALPSLAAALRGHGVRVTMRDLDLEGFLRVVQPARVAAAVESCRQRLGGSSVGHADVDLRRLVDLGDWIAANTPGALDTLRGPRFFDPHRHHQARLCLAGAVRLVSAATGRVRYDISNAAYEVAGVDDSRLADLEAVTADPGASLFEDLYADVLGDLAADRPDLVGVSVLNRQQILPGLRLARLLRQAGHRVVVGGTVYAKFAPELARRARFFELFADAVVPYEGDTAVLALAEAAAAGRSFAGLPNVLALDEHGRVREGPVVVEEVSELPVPDFDGLPLADYLAPHPVLPILTGKGCYFNRCRFCDIPAINAVSPRAYRVRKPDQIVDDVRTLWHRHGARHFEITDEALSPALLRRLADALDAARAEDPAFDPRFVGYARFEPGFTPELCRRLHDVGFRKLFFGLEAGSQAVLDHMDKGVRVDDAHAVLRACDEAGLAVHVFSIVGFPQETEEQARETLGFFLDAAASLAAPRHTFDVHPFGLDLRTEYGDEPARFGIEVDADDLGRRDFPISIRRWRNAGGLSAPRAAELIDEFADVLRDRFPDTRNYPDQLWPGFEEYAVLYGDRFDGQPFGWRFRLPEDGAPERFRLVWADHVLVEPLGGEAAGDRWRVASLDGEVEAPAAVVALLGPARSWATVDDWAAEVLAGTGLAGADNRRRLRAAVEALLRLRALWYVPEPT